MNNEKLTLCGKNYTLKVNSEPIKEPEIRSETIIISNNFKTRKTFGSIESQILKLLKDFSFRILQNKTFEFSQIMNVRYNSVKLRIINLVGAVVHPKGIYPLIGKLFLRQKTLLNT